jgi:hypothetical protein
MTLSVRKLPGWKVLQALFHTLRLLMMIGRTTLHIVNVAKRRTEQLLLVLAVRTPIQPIHHGSLIREALGEMIHFLA